ncbi:malate dehydrogenase [Sarotherodon galilaeus]
MADEHRFVFSVRIIGGVHRDAPKLKMFMLSVLWSDQNEIIIYRSFQDFKEFHKQLKKRFPHLNPFRKDDRMIPKFTGKARRSSVQKKGSKKSVRRMKFLESYLEKLLKCDQSVTRSIEVTRFFTPKDHDLQPDYTKNSVMMLLSDDQNDESGGGGGGSARHFHHGGSITHPFVTQTYHCVAAYETKDTKNRPFKVAKDEKLDVLIKDPAGWWLVENEDKRLAWFPAPYLELSEGDDDDDEDELQLRGALYCAVRSYTSKKVDEISVPIGSVVEVLRKSDNGWWLIRFNGRVGYIPTMYLQPYNNPRAGLHGVHNRLHSSSLNLATASRDRQAPYPPSIHEEDDLHQNYPGPSRQLSEPARLHKARSLDVLSDPWPQGEEEREAPASNSRPSIMSQISSDSIFSELSSSSDSSSSSLREEAQNHADHPAASQQPDSSHSSPDPSLSDGVSFNNGPERGNASVVPRVPPRPKTEEILTRCTTMTRKAALATKARLQIQPESIHSR